MTRLDSEQDEKLAAEAAKNSNRLENVLMKNRTLTLFGEINQDVARRTAEKLLALAFESDDPITLYIGSPGGHVESGDTIFDMIRFIKPVVRTVGTGWVGSIATHIYLASEKENRFALPNTRFLIHQPSGGFGGDATDIQIHAREIVKTRERINGIIATQTGRPVESVAEDTSRDYWMSAEESVEYGLVGKIISDISEIG
ncbi:MAG: ATP-dependent Clp protease proteolytic subunit [Gammaproteobacteria bacterium]|jgi:ATP-dependent Clp protease protease subunit|nr:ATP-dependent Clp protease proteolytic subunit [Gammaproteobacteria bacterium]MDA7723267.1 ATP-dependent Clp protease proteolytic subunit [Pseudomonadales bacterium]MBT5334443.1 ATP-dependent Clp protease proteolytic subunit [Gammaproteobacteria bacterium]MBT5682426.1 ATP-dependent Clp protease proteolytic subunit [Gammaproteobacteria bacterium]MBT6024988.1 ATP-dependent Clp protease proteolytic subunit [Gammaproteobacteria bacterium]